MCASDALHILGATRVVHGCDMDGNNSFGNLIWKVLAGQDAGARMSGARWRLIYQTMRTSVMIPSIHLQSSSQISLQGNIEQISTDNLK